MTNSKSTKRALVSSALAILMCVAMLIGTTFAWFTDTASTGVNKIQAGNLDVALEMQENGNWVSAEGKTLQFKTADNRTTDILWEPGCRYELPALRVVNKGNLALKYKIQITGIQGDAKLNEVIDWTINDAPINLTEGHLDANAEGDSFTIKGVMQTTAGNEYQGLSIDGIGITVVATQYTYEKDSNGNTYDETAEYPVSFTAKVTKNAENKLTAPLNLGASAASVVSETNPVSVTVPTGVKVEDTTTNFDVTIEKSASHPDVTIGEGSEAIAYSIEMPLAADNDVPVPVTMYIGAGRSVSEVYHDGVLMANADTGDADTYQYNSETGVITMYITHCSTFTFVHVPYFPVVANTQTELNDAIESAQNNSSIPTKVVLPAGNFKLDNGTAQNKNITISGTSDTVVTVVGDTGNQMNYQNGATLAFEGVTIQGQTSGNYGGIAHVEETTFVNCTFNGKLTLYGDATFINCTFNNDNDYAIWTWGAKNAEFIGCTFNSGGKAILLYGGAGSTEAPTTNLIVTNCTFYDDDTLTTEKAAIETGDDYSAVYNLTVNNITVNGFAVNPEGTSTGSKIWANKNNMDAAHLTVTIDGTKIQ